MSIADLIRRMKDAGAPMEAILIAVEALEAEQTKDADRRAKRAAQKRKERECRATVARQSHDVDATVATKVSPSLSPKEKSPPITPSKEITPISTPSKNARDARSLAVQAAFDAFWRRWPHKVGKPAAEKSFAKVSGEIEAILLGVDRYIRDKPPDRPWLNPATFLNQRRWEDAPADQPCAVAKPKERDLRNVPDSLLSAEDYWRKRKQQREYA